MIERVLQQFPPHTHGLTLVSDPDRVLADEGLLAALAERGFRLVNETDPVRLRGRVEEMRPFCLQVPLIVVTAGALKELPYDLWQQGHPVVLALHTFFPNLAYPLVSALTPGQRWRLSQAPAPAKTLGRQGSMDYILRHVFALDFGTLRQPAALIAWLDGYHQQADAMPMLFTDCLLAHLHSVPTYADWPLEELLAQREAFVAFVREQWRGYVQQQTGQLLSEKPVRYVLDFQASEALQDVMPRLARSGTVTPLQVQDPECLPRWARAAVLAPDEDRLQRRLGELLSLLEGYRAGPVTDARWPDWQGIARTWAELTSIRYNPEARLEPKQRAACVQLQEWLDAAFVEWLRRSYAPLGSQRLPVPHHVHHVPDYVAFQRRQNPASRVALCVLDGLALPDWYLIGSAWRARHPNWRFVEQLLLAQIPTQTAISRQALVSGLRPADFAATLYHNQAEPQHWTAFWARQEVPADACAYVHVALPRAEPPALDSPRLHALCLVYSRIDEMAHDATLGAGGVQASLQLWLQQESPRLEALLAQLLERGFVIYLTSDHGHVEARGFGQPSEGLLVQALGKRARLYADALVVKATQMAFHSTILWSDDGLLPAGVWALMPEGREAFATHNQVVVTHGGMTLDEMVVPLVTITES
jgi:hypothetical protein